MEKNKELRKYLKDLSLELKYEAMDTSNVETSYLFSVNDEEHLVPRLHEPIYFLYVTYSNANYSHLERIVYTSHDDAVKLLNEDKSTEIEIPEKYIETIMYYIEKEVKQQLTGYFNETSIIKRISRLLNNFKLTDRYTDLGIYNFVYSDTNQKHTISFDKNTSSIKYIYNNNIDYTYNEAVTIKHISIPDNILKYLRDNIEDIKFSVTNKPLLDYLHSRNLCCVISLNDDNTYLLRIGNIHENKDIKTATVVFIVYNKEDNSFSIVSDEQEVVDMINKSTLIMSPDVEKLDINLCTNLEELIDMINEEELRDLRETHKIREDILEKTINEGKLRRVINNMLENEVELVKINNNNFHLKSESYMVKIIPNESITLYNKPIRVHHYMFEFDFNDKDIYDIVETLRNLYEGLIDNKNLL